MSGFVIRCLCLFGCSGTMARLAILPLGMPEGWRRDHRAGVCVCVCMCGGGWGAVWGNPACDLLVLVIYCHVGLPWKLSW